MSLFLAVLLLLNGDRTKADVTSGGIVLRINAYRTTGIPKGDDGSIYTSVFALENSNYLELYASINTHHCRTSNVVPLGGSMIFHTTPLTSKSSIDYNLITNIIDQAWFAAVDQLVYNTKNISNFAKMMYWKSTRAGCAYRVCNATEAPVFALACVFNNAPKMGEPFVPAIGSGFCCTKDSECSEVLPFSKCDINVTQLCLAGNVTFPVSNTSCSCATATSAATSSSTTTTTTTTTATPSTTTTTTTTPSTTTTTATNPSNPMTDALRTKIIDMHNYRRSRLAQGLVPNGLTDTKAPSGQNIFQMSYDTDLEQDAQNYANLCPSNGSSLTSRSQHFGDSEGENFGVVFANSTYNAVFQAVKSFWREIKLNPINKEMHFTETLAGRPLVRFTQMAWAGTAFVGCGAKLCGSQYVVVCRYWPRGNIVGQNIYEVGTTCGSCSDTCTTAYLYKGLCELLPTATG